MVRTRFLLISAAAAVAACSDGSARSAADSAELARDLELVARGAPVYPEFRDTALGAKALEPEPSPRRAEAPRRTPQRVAATPERRVPRAPVETAPESRATAPETVKEPPRAESRFRGFQAGASFPVETKSAVCTTNRPGDKIVGTLTAAVAGENGAIMPAGTSVVLEVESVVPGDTPAEARIVLRVRSILLGDDAISPEADVTIVSELERREIPRDGGSDRRKVVTGAVAGAVIGQIMGRDTKSTVIGAATGAAAGAAAAAATGKKYDACLPAGSSVRVTTTQQIAIAA